MINCLLVMFSIDYNFFIYFNNILSFYQAYRQRKNDQGATPLRLLGDIEVKNRFLEALRKSPYVMVLHAERGLQEKNHLLCQFKNFSGMFCG